MSYDISYQLVKKESISTDRNLMDRGPETVPGSSCVITTGDCREEGLLAFSMGNGRENTIFCKSGRL